MSGNRLSKKLSLAGGFSALAVLLVTGAAAGTGGQEQIKFNPADQAAARAVIIRRSDLGPGKWTGGPTKPDLSPSPTCPGYDPKQSDLVMTGAAEADWAEGITSQGTGVQFVSAVSVLQTARMVQLDWQRTVIAPAAISCLGQTLAASTSKAKLTSFVKVAQIAPYLAEFRGVFQINEHGHTLMGVLDFLFVGRGRTELTLATEAIPFSPTAASGAALTLAHRLIARAKT